MSYYPDLSAYYAAAAANPFTAAAAVRLAAASPPMKRARVMVPPQGAAIPTQRTVIAKSPSTPPARKPQGNVCLDELKTYCTGPDILICGNCREMFRSLSDLLHHKRDYCKLRFACKCSHETHQTPSLCSVAAAPDEASSALLCGLCTEPFLTAWLLLEHFQTTHSVEIYKLGNDEDSNTGEHQCRTNGNTTDDSEQDSRDTDAGNGNHQKDGETDGETNSTAGS
ncbi:uncharacterized protein LOC122385774 isoform X2 [Amphibalanus amphitrite]|uniref:uncharacterized protein LOC122385774 isoform X2 n=1 Tax=Amphibalanus amphitrite TaxID=1232801 RepID=UPI001C8FD90B|nr:uncharacterized protein LOC122385774 isoform X2 [Amphibalanus amphitrite]